MRCYSSDPFFHLVPVTGHVTVPQSDRRKAQAAMEAAWKSMEKKEKIPWIKKAAEDQKRYEVQYQAVVSEPLTRPTC